MLNTDRIKELEEEIKKLQEADAKFLALTPEQQLAITLHKMLCHHNHVDGCGWEYEYNSQTKSTEWNGHAHSRYLSKAQKISRACERLNIKVEDAIGLIELANGYYD